MTLVVLHMIPLGVSTISDPTIEQYYVLNRLQKCVLKNESGSNGLREYRDSLWSLYSYPEERYICSFKEGS